MQTITLGRARYTVHANRIDFMSKLLSYTGKPKKTRLAPVQRRFPPAGAHVSTDAYVRTYYAMNALGSIDHFAPLSELFSQPQGVDSVEIEA